MIWDNKSARGETPRKKKFKNHERRDYPLAENQRKLRLTKKRLERYKEQFNMQSMEIAGLAQSLIKRRIERALKNEAELDKLMEELLYHTERSEDKAKSKSIISRFDSLKIEDLTKLASVLKIMWDKDLSPSDEKEAPIRQLKFEDIYDI